MEQLYIIIKIPEPIQYLYAMMNILITTHDKDLLLAIVNSVSYSNAKKAMIFPIVI
jgi:hypothetical protein